MTAVEKHLKKKFNIESESKFLKIVSSKTDNFFQKVFFCEKQQYVEKITSLMASINEQSKTLADTIGFTRSGSGFNPWSGWAYGDLMSQYKTDLKNFENHVSFFKTKSKKYK